MPDYPEEKSECTFVEIAPFFHEHNISIPKDILAKIYQAVRRGANHIEIPNTTLRLIEKATSERKLKERRLYQCYENNNKGIALEKKGEIDAAIEVYEANIKDGYLALHSYNRLMVLYRKRKDFENEVRVIDYSIELFSCDDRYNNDIEKWQKRRAKAIQLKNKL